MIDITSSGDDLGAAIALFAEEYQIPNFTSQPTDEVFTWRHTIRGDDRMTFRTSRFAAHLSGIPEVNDDYIVWWNRAGRSLVGSGQGALHVRTESPMLLARHHPTAIQHFDVTHNLVHLGHRFVESVALESSDRFAGFVAFDGGAPVSAEASRWWRTSVNQVGALWLPTTDDLSDILRYELSHTMAVALLSTFPFCATGIVSPLGGIEPRTVRLAVEFAYANAHLPISGSDIAAAIGVSPRALQQAFRRHLETTPGALLRSIRLDHVREELLQYGPQLAQVSEVARRWGFIHLGRFSASYYSAFNELPSQTLRSSAA